MGLIVVMTGGGIKGAVAAAGRADEQEIVFFHVSYGQRSANAELNAVQALCGSLPAARVVGVNMPHVLQLQDGLADVDEQQRVRGGSGGRCRGVARSFARGASRVVAGAGFRGRAVCLAARGLDGGSGPLEIG